MIVRFRLRSTGVYLVTTLIVVLVLLHMYASDAVLVSTTHKELYPDPLRSEANSRESPGCRYSATLRGKNTVAVVVKTGTTEVHEKLRAQLRTVLRCIKDVLIVSDLEGELDGSVVHDVLADITPSVLSSHADFELYRKQQRLQKLGMDLEQIGRRLQTDEKSSSAAWILDKYKFLPMLIKAWHLRPGKDWYVFIEADTYLIWPSLLIMLSQLDPAKELYIGSQECYNTTNFAYGGSGTIISHVAMRKIVEDHDLALGWIERVESECCGDYVLGRALLELQLPIVDVWPLLSSGTPFTLPYGPATWCQSVVAMHHMTPDDVDAMWAFERQHHERHHGPILYKDVYNYFIEGELPDVRIDWDNRCPGHTFDITNFEAQLAGTSQGACGEACIVTPDCFQYLYRANECRLYKCFTFGKSIQPYRGTPWHSGWNRDRIGQWKAEQSC